MLIPSFASLFVRTFTSLSRRVNANSQHIDEWAERFCKLIKKGEC